MKSSKYNTFLKVTESSTIIYNALQDKTIICRGDINSNNIIFQSESLLKVLEKEGFIVSDEKNEYELYIIEARKIENDKKSFHLLINPTINCNFRCWYCYESHVPSKMSYEVMNRVRKLIKKIY